MTTRRGKILDEVPFDPLIMGGSIKRGIVNPDILEERAKCNFDKEEGYRTLYTAA